MVAKLKSTLPPRPPPSNSHKTKLSIESHGLDIGVREGIELKGVERTLPRLLKPSSVPSKIMAKCMKVERRKWKSKGLICGFGGFLSAHTTVGR
nr:hypothetical protein CFP56_72328 [Quercus suber]